MSKARRKYTEAFKLEALELLSSSGLSAAQIERDLGITSGLLLKWRERYQVTTNQREPELAPSELAAAQTEIKRLRRQLAHAEQERAILKKP